MSAAPDQPIRPGPGRIAAIVLLGPLIGALGMIGLMSLFDPPPGGFDDLGGLLEFLAFVLAFGWVFGLVPAGLAAFAYARAFPRLLRFPQRLLAAIVIGAACGAVGVWPAVWLFAGRFQFELPFALFSAGAGAIALVLTALPFSWRP